MLMRTLAIAILSYIAFALATFHPWRTPSALAATVSAVCLLGAAGAVALVLRDRRGLVPCALFTGLLLALGLFLMARRVEFIAVNHSMEGPAGQGSPAAFIIGWLFEQALTTVPALLFGFGLWRVSGRA
jgi:hypothetical protein